MSNLNCEASQHFKTLHSQLPRNGAPRSTPYLYPHDIHLHRAIILINIGGVIPGHNHYLTFRERNSDFKLLSWNFTITSSSSTRQYYSYSLHLNRLCFSTHVSALSSASAVSPVTTYCRNNLRTNSKIRDGASLYASNIYVSRVSPFRFDTVLLGVPLVFFLLTAIVLVFLMLVAAVCGFGSKNRLSVSRGKWGTGLGMSVVALVFMLIASSVLTWQVTNLRWQIENETLRLRSLRGTGYNAGVVGYVTDVNRTELGSVALGLMWSDVVGMALEVGLWAWVWIGVGKERASMGKELNRKGDRESGESYATEN
ncbi:hypothetical protein BGZ60DRAFT_402873 [Tricladium varicosporioides]|nr:hypothetical protein BGZ60DRAFT_402873 [Hymenoscyphus varicosporioides]